MFHAKCYFHQAKEMALCRATLPNERELVNVCVYFFRNPNVYKIVVGDHNRNTNEGTEEEVGAKRVIAHPQYNSPGRLNNDIALIQLASPVKLSQRVNPICLPSHDSDVATGSKCYITGETSYALFRSQP